MKRYLLTEMTWEEVRDALRTVELAIIPIGAHEQHGPHIVESCDAVLATEMAKKLGERLFPKVLITPTVNMGVSSHHLNYPGTITLRPKTLISILEDMVASLKLHGIQKFLFLNSHGGNQSTLDVAASSISMEQNVDIYYAKTTSSAKNAISKNIKSTLFGHSCEREVSEAYYLAPQLIRHEKITKGEINEEGRWKKLRPGQAIQGFYRYEEMTKNGCIGDATKASYEIGKEIVEEALENLERAIEELLSLDVQKCKSLEMYRV
ncbi:creatininase family protein [Calidifontibacillus erzurumensis]|uniref:Creatininase family protein n=1 Tax=Calidifontibacillus erzurumensis TaxID=2741433 RepID=A0A8J8KCI0_9BACI|nr:creatininase family protein [Calidifontibacillus erzurumensis]NSL53094.1 creatininase family protein [Calidifontibacillus erzurumensis]